MEAERGTVFVVDDNESVRSGLRRLLAARGFAVECFASAQSYLGREPFEGTGCLLVDLRMPGMGGLELQEELRISGSEIPMVFLSGHGDVPTSVRAMKSGAVDFLTKPVDEVELLAAVHGALSRHERLREERRTLGPFQARLKSLTPREEQVMRLVIAGLLNKQIAATLGISEKTVKGHRGQVMDKLQPGSVADLVRFCEALGIEPDRAADRASGS